MEAGGDEDQRSRLKIGGGDVRCRPLYTMKLA